MTANQDYILFDLLVEHGFNCFAKLIKDSVIIHEYDTLKIYPLAKNYEALRFERDFEAIRTELSLHQYDLIIMINKIASDVDDVEISNDYNEEIIVTYPRLLKVKTILSKNDIDLIFSHAEKLGFEDKFIYLDEFLKGFCQRVLIDERIEFDRHLAAPNLFKKVTTFGNIRFKRFNESENHHNYFELVVSLSTLGDKIHAFSKLLDEPKKEIVLNLLTSYCEFIAAEYFDLKSKVPVAVAVA